MTASLCFLVLHMTAQPFKNHGDDYLGNATNFSLVMILLAVVVLKVAILSFTRPLRP